MTKLTSPTTMIVNIDIPERIRKKSILHSILQSRLIFLFFEIDNIKQNNKILYDNVLNNIKFIIKEILMINTDK